MMSAGHQSDFRNSVRFPLHLQVKLKTPTGEYYARTRDISAGGIRFQINSIIDVGSAVEFVIDMPMEVLGGDQPVQVMCRGRVVRCTDEATGKTVAVAIDEYHFKRP